MTNRRPTDVSGTTEDLLDALVAAGREGDVHTEIAISAEILRRVECRGCRGEVLETFEAKQQTGLGGGQIGGW